MAAVVVDSDIVSYQFKRDSRSALYRPHLVLTSFIMALPPPRLAPERDRTARPT